MNLSYSKRADHTSNPLAKELFLLMDQKMTNLSLSLDVTNKDEFLKLADQIGPEICILKTHIDTLEDFDMEVIEKLQELSKKHKFLIFEDRKFADIGNTVKNQYEKGIYKIASWADIVNAHPIVGPGIVEGLSQVGSPLNRGLLLLAQMSAKDNLIDESYTKQTVEMAKKYSDFVIGFISMEKIVNDPGLIHLTPGVQFGNTQDNLGQQYKTPYSVIYEKESDVIIVGRGIYDSDNPVEQAKLYRQEAWQAYLKRIEENLND